MSALVPEQFNKSPIDCVGYVFDASVLPARFDRVMTAIEEPGSSVLLLGDAGSGKAQLSEAVAYALESQENSDVFATVMAPPPDPTSGIAALFGLYFPEILEHAASDNGIEALEPALLARRLLDAILQRAEGREPVLVVQRIDDFPAISAFLLEHLVRSRRLRIIATARHLTGAANRISFDPRVKRITIGPLSLEEADEYLSRLLGVTHIAPATLVRWHSATGGNSQALGTFALSCDRRGLLRRSRGMAWVPPDVEDAPVEFSQFVAETCTDEERRALEQVAQAEPMIESVLLRLVDPTATSSLIARGIVRARRHPNGEIALEATHPILAEAVRAHMPPERRVELCAEFYRALEAERRDSSLLDTPQQLTRLVTFGLDSGQDVPHEWLTQAFRFLQSGASPRLFLRVAIELAHGSDPVEAAVAAAKGALVARLLGNMQSLGQLYSAIDAIVAAPEMSGALPVALHTRLRLLQIEQRFWLGAEMDGILAELSELEGRLDATERVSIEMVRSDRFTLLAYSGRLQEAASNSPTHHPPGDLTIEWVRGPARALNALILQQNGQLEDAIREAENARHLSLLGSKHSPEEADLQGFCWFLGFWASGSTEAGRQILEELEEGANADVQTAAYLSGLLEAGAALFAVQEGRWRDAADQSERLLEQLRPHDGFGLSPLLHATHALALAAMGEDLEATRAYRRALRESRGVAQAVAGFRRRLLVRTQQWLRLGNPLNEALKLAEWAAQEQLALVELEALHLAAFESRAVARANLSRVRALAAAIDQPIGDVILSHIEKIVDGIPASDAGEPEVRLLAELGLWLPLPTVGDLSPREREIALFASLGYSSKFISERLHLSVRTVDTHIGHIYSKVGVADREGLRRWFSNDRQLNPHESEVPTVPHAGSEGSGG